VILTSNDETSFCFDVLGPVRVWRQGAELELGARQQRLILALLLARAGQPVSAGDIVEVLWGGRPPKSAMNVVHRYVGALRRLLEPGLPARSGGRWLIGDAAGYRMRVDSGNLDLLRLRALAGQGRSDEAAGRLPEAMAAFEAALQLWRGPCGGVAELMAGNHLAFDVVDHECADLVREATSLALRLDRVRSVLPVLRRVAENRPLDEALQAQLLMALSADGQQAEAITLHHSVRRRLADELGVDPGEELRGAYQAVLRQPAPAPPGTGSADRGHAPGNRGPGATTVLPAQLPADLPYFTGRDEAQRRALSLINGHVMAQVSTPVLAIDGIAGIGKTSLAIRLAHQLADVYPDGQLYVDLQGFDPAQSELHPAVALQGFLNALGVPDADIPTSDHARSGLYRSVLAGRRILVVLDNAHSVEQVRPLLPGTPGCLVLVSSRKRLTGLAAAHGAHLMSLDVLSPGDARRFLTSRLGEDRTSADPEAVDEIVERCGRLPLALAMVAARALIHADHPLIEIARELRDAQGSLDGFCGDDMGSDIRAIFSWSYRKLGAGAARAFRLLSLHPGPDVTVPAMASLAGVPLAEARLLAGELAQTGLLREHPVGRYTAHDLIRAYAQELVGLHEDDRTRGRAFDRLVSHYRQTAYHADLYLRPAIVLDPPEPREAVVTTRVDDDNGAIAWFAAERQVIKAVIQREIEYGHATSAWRLAASLQRFVLREGWWHDWAAVCRACLQAAVVAGDDPGRAYLTLALAGVERNLGDHESATSLLHQSLDLFVLLGDRLQEAMVYHLLGQVSYGRQDYLESIAYLERALPIFESLGEQHRQVLCHCWIGSARTGLGRPDLCMEVLERAEPIVDSLGDLELRAHFSYTRAECLHAAGDLSAALTGWRIAAEAFERINYRVGLVDTLLHEGDTALVLGDEAGARAVWQRARDLLASQQNLPLMRQVQERLSRWGAPDGVRGSAAL
jgi:DNA-binding SARP family transcriptional activator/tetratricopeptide (TPR) repeat protein